MFMVSNRKCISCDVDLNGNRIKFCSSSCSSKYKYLINKDLYNGNSYARQVEKYRYRKFKLIDLRGNKGCESCGYIKNIGALEFHHIDPNTKLFTLDSRKLSNKSWESILEEFKKCTILCANCHREHHNPELEFNDRLLYDEKPDFEKIIINCIDCDIVISNKALRCEPCNKVYSRKSIRPSIETLLEELLTNSYVSLGKKYGVSDNTIRKWIKVKNPS